MKKRRIYLRHLLIGLLSGMSLILMSGKVQARPLTLELLTSPLNVRTIEVGATERITIIARVDSEDVQFTWMLAGPGQLEEDTPPRKAFYTPPQQIAAASVEVTITVSAAETRGDTARESLTFTLRAPEVPATPSTPPNPTPTPTPPVSSEITQLLNTADAYFQRTFYTEPEGQNALSLYQQVLERDPSNQHALEKIHTMAANYKMWAERDVQQQEYIRASKYYQRYLFIAEYLLTTFDEPHLAQDMQAVRQRLQELGQPATPPPAATFTPSPPPALPTATPTPTPTVKPTPTISPVAQLLERGDACFERKEYTTPADNNAFDHYKAVLQIDPTNQHARSKLYDIASIYKNWGDTAYAQNDCTKAQTYYERYLSVAEYIQARVGDQTLHNEIQHIQERVQECFAPIPPTKPPLETPAIPPLNCPSQTKNLNELLQQSLPEHLERYKELKNQESQGSENLHQQFITTIEYIICDLLAIERILQEHYDQTKDANILQRLQKVQQTRKNFAEERINRFIIMKP